MKRVENLLNLDGRAAVVTGAGQGVGRQVAIHLASYGARVLVNDYFPDRAETVAEEINGFGGEAVPHQADVTSFQATEAMMEAASSQFGSLDILVNNAGNLGPVAPDAADVMKPFWESTPDDWERPLSVNLYGVLNCTRHALGRMVAGQGGGSIVTIISEASRYGDPCLEAYAGAKAGAAGIMRSVARETARFGVRANCVAIGATRTPATAEAFENEQAMKASLRLYPLRRVGEPEDVANAVLFLASEAASYVTGQVYAVNGGFLFTL
ncbi:MAG: SDR family NAD(P)-dependent oxidoreductase [Gammaproteobacteria bacterium]|nr:SDR family NAD(P)-dependent oxidoreductase [Gammaproteobacteria bacterium]MDD9963472.1 SDR family NAD(P)-dependent oxidoreductase [Gammaproteobacteria bacterium]MDE0273842.1 SDR family NAD(P)-dependent oxidoreductase [Gammaproteobacteria bacterium]